MTLLTSHWKRIPMSIKVISAMLIWYGITGLTNGLGYLFSRAYYHVEELLIWRIVQIVWGALYGLLGVGLLNLNKMTYYAAMLTQLIIMVVMVFVGLTGDPREIIFSQVSLKPSPILVTGIVGSFAAITAWFLFKSRHAFDKAAS